MDFATMLKAAREKSGLSTRQLAAKTGVTCGAITLWEHARSIPRFDVVLRLEVALGFTQGYFSRKCAYACKKASQNA